MLGFPGGTEVKNLPAMQETQEMQVQSLVQRKWQPIPVFLPGKSYGKRGLASYSPWGHKAVGYNLETKQKQYIYNRILDI